MTTTHFGFHTQDAWTFEVFFHPVNDEHGRRGWYWWRVSDKDGEAISEEDPTGPFDTSQDAFIDATDYTVSA
jgi:hypothetical protein